MDFQFCAPLLPLKHTVSVHPLLEFLTSLLCTSICTQSGDQLIISALNSVLFYFFLILSAIIALNSILHTPITISKTSGFYICNCKESKWTHKHSSYYHIYIFLYFNLAFNSATHFLYLFFLKCFSDFHHTSQTVTL